MLLATRLPLLASAFLSACVFAAAVSASADAQELLPPTLNAASLFHSNLIRTVDLSSGGNVRETVSVAVENKGSSAVHHYYVALPASRADNVAHYSVKEKKSGKRLDISEAGIDPKRSLQFYKIAFEAPLAPRQTRTITMRFTHSGLLDPLPREIDQNEQQRLLYSGNVYFYSPYPSEKQKIVVKMPSAKLLSPLTGPKPVSQDGSTITYGPYENVTAFAEHPLKVHFESLKGIVEVKNLLREIEISHWGGNAAIEEHYEFSHAGARLKTPFRRVDYQLFGHMQHMTSAVRSIDLTLPAGARDPYYRDEIGNVSTSNFRNDLIRGRSLLQLRPRYPLYGGWNYTCYLGYNLPIGDVVHTVSRADAKSSGDGRYVLKAPFVNKVDTFDVSYDAVEVKVILPEGATNIQYYVPFSILGSEDSITKTYLDTVGRPTLHLFVNRLAPEDGHLPFEVTYDLPFLEYFRKPLSVAAALFFGVFLTSVVFSRIETRIVIDEVPFKEISNAKTQ